MAAGKKFSDVVIVGGGASGNVFDAVFLEGLPDAVARFHVHVLHAAQRKVVLLQERIVRKNGEDVGEGVSDAQDGFHGAGVFPLTYKFIHYLGFSINFVSAMDKKLTNILQYVLWTAVAAVLLYFSFRGVDWKDFGAALRGCRWGYVVLSMVLGAVVFYVRALRWRMQLLPLDASTSRLTCWNAYNICMLTNIVLPRVGEVHRQSPRDGRRGPPVGRRVADGRPAAAPFAHVGPLRVLFHGYALPRPFGQGPPLVDPGPRCPPGRRICLPVLAAARTGRHLGPRVGMDPGTV